VYVVPTFLGTPPPRPPTTSPSPQLRVREAKSRERAAAREMASKMAGGAPEAEPRASVTYDVEISSPFFDGPRQMVVVEDEVISGLASPGPSGAGASGGASGLASPEPSMESSPYKRSEAATDAGVCRGCGARCTCSSGPLSLSTLPLTPPHFTREDRSCEMICSRLFACFCVVSFVCGHPYKRFCCVCWFSPDGI
jgi:hypothetical protein